MPGDNFKQDIRYTVRTLRRDAGFFAAAVLIIGLGIGVNTAMFSVVNTLLFQPLRFSASDRLVWIANTGADGGLSSVTSRVANYLDWRKMNHSFEDLTAYFAFFDYGTYNLIGMGEPERLVGAGVAQNFLGFLGVKPALGREFLPQECEWNGSPAVILTHGLWERRFGADAKIIGQSITLNDKPTVVVGVLPATFDFSAVFTPGSRVDMLVSFPLAQQTDRWGNTLAVIGRLKPGVSIQQAQAEFDVLNEQIRRDPSRWRFGARMTSLRDYLTGRFRRGLLVLLGAVGAVLLIACTNLSNLLLARAASRRKEIAIRSALGAGRLRLIRQMLTESLLLSSCGALLGLGLAALAVKYLRAIQSVSIPLLRTVEVDRTALLFTILAALATGILFGIVPALQTSGLNDFHGLKDTGRGSSEGKNTAWTRSVLVVSEVAVACVLLVGAGLLIRSFARVLEVDLGFQPERAAVWRIESGSRYPNAAQRLAFFDRLVRAVEAIPGVESAGLTDALPLSRDRSWFLGARGVTYPPGQVPIAHPRMVDPHYISTMRIRMSDGRGFNEQDTATSEKVILINEHAAKTLWPDRSAVGQIAIAGSGPVRVVGVVGNVRYQALEQESGLEMYFPLTQQTMGSVELVVRTKLPPETLAPSVRTALRSIEPTLPTAEFQVLGELVDRAVSPRRFMMLLLTGFAVAALLLASIGIYGVVSYSVSQRTQEIGIRMALGASAGQVQRHVMAKTVALVSGGVAIGVMGALALGRLTASLLYRLEPADPPTFAVTVVALLGVALSAGYLPARRASRVDPMSALRTD